jgi:hypothetical protein
MRFNPPPRESNKTLEIKTTIDYAREVYAGLRKADELNLDVMRIARPTGEFLALALRHQILSSAANR